MKIKEAEVRFGSSASRRKLPHTGSQSRAASAHRFLFLPQGSQNIRLFTFLLEGWFIVIDCLFFRPDRLADSGTGFRFVTTEEFYEQNDKGGKIPLYGQICNKL